MGSPPERTSASTKGLMLALSDASSRSVCWVELKRAVLPEHDLGGFGPVASDVLGAFDPAFALAEIRKPLISETMREAMS